MANYLEDTDLTKQLLLDKRYYIYKLKTKEEYDITKFKITNYNSSFDTYKNTLERQKPQKSLMEVEHILAKKTDYGYEIKFINNNLYCTPIGFYEKNLFYDEVLLLSPVTFRLLASDTLASMFMLMQERILSLRKWRGYTNEYKNELRSMGSLFFARYWWKYNPLRVKKNIINGINEEMKYNFDNPKQLFGAFTYFTNLITSANLGGISDINKSKKHLQNNESRREYKEEEINTMRYNGEIDNGCYI